MGGGQKLVEGVWWNLYKTGTLGAIKIVIYTEGVHYLKVNNTPMY